MDGFVFLGKGGTGKTVLASLTARVLTKRYGMRVLLVDADPTAGLTTSLGITPRKTIAALQRDLKNGLRKLQDAGPEEQSALVDYLLLEAMVEKDGFGLIAMGQSESAGCFCKINELLRDGLKELPSVFDVAIVDAEAGFEQIYRLVTKEIGTPIIVTDSSVRGVVTAERIVKALENTGSPRPLGVLFNRCAEPPVDKVARLAQSSLQVLGAIPFDPVVAGFDAEGRSLLDVPDDSISLLRVEQVLQREVTLNPK